MRDLPALDIEIVSAATAENIVGPVCVIFAVVLFISAETTILS